MTTMRNYNTQLRCRDRKIDSLVYKLYDLTPAEIAIVIGRDS